MALIIRLKWNVVSVEHIPTLTRYRIECNKRKKLNYQTNVFFQSDLLFSALTDT